MAKTLNDTPWRDAIIQVMRDAGRPMHRVDITEEVIHRKLRKSLGATPARTVLSYLSEKKENSPFLRVAPATYVLREAGQSPKNDVGLAKAESTETAQADILTAFGMFWRRELIDWKNSPRILGCQDEGSDPVDFCNQLGVYFLYDGREVIYVGRSTDRPLGIRLWEHTRDRLATRWDRFSWFGVLPVSSDGKLGKQPASYAQGSLIATMEALLIEALEPRQNRKRGDDLSASEFIQMEDPSLSSKRKKALMEEMVKKLES
jgi:hypothetical protein